MARRDAMINFHVEAILILVPISGARSKSLLRKEIDSLITATLVPAQPPKVPNVTETFWLTEELHTNRKLWGNPSRKRVAAKPQRHRPRSVHANTCINAAAEIVPNDPVKDIDGIPNSNNGVEKDTNKREHLVSRQ